MVDARLLIVAVLLCTALADAYSPPTSPEGFHFLVEAKVIIDGKAYNPTNISITISPNTTIPAYSFNLSAANFNKNVTVPLRLFAWYNGQWTLSRQSITIKLTDKRNVYRLKSHLLAKLLKFNSRRYEAKMVDDKEITVFTSPKVIISYDPESSLLVSRMEDPHIFSQQDSYVPLEDLTVEMKKSPMRVSVSFDLLTRSDALITIKNHIVSLNELATKVRERIPFIRQWEDIVDPFWILKTLVSNFDKIKQSHKQYLEKATLMTNKKYQSLFLPRLHQIPYSLPEAAHKLAASYNVSLADPVVPTFYYILSQGFILDSINQVQNYLRSNISDSSEYDSLGLIERWAKVDVMASFGVAVIWILLDIISYQYKQIYPGLSISFGYFFMAWLIFEQISLAVRVGSAIHPYWGIGYFFLSLILIKLIVTPIQRNFNRSHHKYSYFDKVTTQSIFNLIILGVIANGALHILVEKDIKNLQIIFWGLGQFQMLLQEYYYFLAMIPPFLLSFRLKSTVHVGWVRILLLLLVGLKDNYWLIMDNGHWFLIALRLKEEILFLLFVILKIAYGNKRVEMIEQPKEKEPPTFKVQTKDAKEEEEKERSQELDREQENSESSLQENREKEESRERQKRD